MTRSTIVPGIFLVCALVVSSRQAETAVRFQGAMHTGAIRSLAVDPGDRYLVTASDDRSIRVWDLTTGRLQRTIPLGGKMLAVAISPDGRTIASGGYAGRETRADQGNHIYYAVYVHDRESGKLLHSLSVPFIVEGLDYSRDGAFLVVTSLGADASTSTDFGADRIYRTSDYRRDKDAFVQPAVSAQALADFDARGRLLLLQKFGEWNAEIAGPETHETRGIPGIPTAARASPDGKLIAVAFADATVAVLSGDDLSLRYEPDVAGIGPAEVQFTDEMDVDAVSRSTVAWSHDGASLHFTGGRTCTAEACFVRTWSDGGRGPARDVIASRRRITDIVGRKDGSLLYGTVDPALGILDREGQRVVAPAGMAPPASATVARTAAAKREEPEAPAAVRDQLHELHDQITDALQRARPVEALAPAQRAVAAAEQALGPDHLLTARARLDLARVQQTIGSYREAAGDGYLLMPEYNAARDLYRAAVPVLEQRLGRDDAEVVTALLQQSSLLRALQEYDQAADVLNQVVARSKNDRISATATADLVALRVSKHLREHRLVDAFAAAQAAVAEAERSLPPGDPGVAQALANLAEVHRESRASSPEAALHLHERALAIREQALGRDHWEVVNSQRAIGELHVTLGEPAPARTAYARALEIEEQVLGADHSALATFAVALAGAEESLGDRAKAEQLYRHALAMREQAEIAHELTPVLDGLARHYRRQGEGKKAEPLYERELAILETRSGARHFKVAETLRSLGTLHRVRGDDTGAEAFYERAAAIHREGGGEALTWMLYDQAALALARGDHRAALHLLEQSLATQESTLDVVLRPGSEERQLDVTTSRRVSASFHFLVWLVSQHLRDDPQAVKEALDVVLQRKGLALDLQSRTAIPVAQLSPQAREARDRLQAARRALASLLLQRPEGMKTDEYRARLVAAFERSSEAESTLGKLTASSKPLRRIAVDEIAAKLPDGSALVEMVRIPDLDYAREDFDFPTPQATDRARYIAFVVRPPGKVALIDLGAAAPLDELVDLVRRDMHADDGGQWRPHLRRLHDLLWAPLERALDGTQSVVLSPDGALNLLSFATLMDEHETFLLERYAIAYVSSGRELLDAPARSTAGAPLLVADPMFDATPEPRVAGPTTRSRSSAGHFEPLEGVAREAAEIASLVPGGGTWRVLEGADATESAVKAAPSPRVLHMATHGFFLQDPKLGMDEVQYETPLVRSGLALAGANRAAEAQGEDGLLTALEIAGMDLSATQLAVLSACETAAGAPKIGEGVFGLRRAFALAGARSLVMSLWKVEDETTADQMRDFYARLRDLPPADALRQAQLATLGTGPHRPAPRRWGAFIYQGGRPFEPLAAR